MNALPRSLFTRGGLAAVLLLGLPALQPLHAQGKAETIMSEPLGLMEISVPGGKMQTLSFPLRLPPVFTAKVSSVSEAGVTAVDADWPAGAFVPYQENPFVIRIISGKAQGRYFPVFGQEGNTLTLRASAPLNTLVAPGDLFDIVPVDTLSELFVGVLSQLTASSDQTKADNVLLHDGSGWNVFYYDGQHWRNRREPGVVFDNAAVLPDHGVIFHRRGGRALTLRLVGAVPLDEVVSELPANRTRVLANVFPKARKLSELGLQRDSSWRSGKSLREADCVRIHTDKRGWRDYYFNGKNWVEDGKGKSDPVIPQGSAVLIRRLSGPSMLHTQTPPY